MRRKANEKQENFVIGNGGNDAGICAGSTGKCACRCNQESEALQQIIEEATQKGIVFVAAAGNSGDRGVAYPAAYEDVLAVGAVNA